MSAPVEIPPPTLDELAAIEQGRAYSAARDASGSGPVPDTQAIDGAGGCITLGGCAYRVSQPTPMDLAAVVAHVKRQIKTPMQELKDEETFQLLPAEEQQVLMRDCARHYYQHKDTWLAAQISEALLSPEGVAFCFWVFCRKEQPTLALEEVRSHINEANCSQIFVQLNVESAMAELGNLAGRSGSK